MRTIMRAGLWLGAFPASFMATGNVEASTPTFEVASVKPSLQSGGNNIDISQRTLTMRGVTLAVCMKWAYDIQDSQIAGNNPLGSQRYDIVANANTIVPVDQMKLMLQSLLADRFRLALHHRWSDQNVYFLVVGKNGPKLHPSVGEGVSAQRGKGTMIAQWTTMKELAAFLSGPTQTSVIDDTGLQGQYDFTLDLTPYLESDAQQGRPADFVGAVIGGLQEQLGLKLESRKMAVDVLVIDHVEEPSAN